MESFDGSSIRNIVLLPDWLIDLQKEVTQHYPHLITKYNLEQADYTEVIAALAAEVNIVVDGMFTAKQQEALVRIIIQRLQNRRSIVVIPTLVQKG